MEDVRTVLKSYLGLVLGICAFLLSVFLPRQSGIVERIYSRGIYLAIRQFYDFIDPLFVIPGILIALIIVVIWPVGSAFAQKKKQEKPWYFLLRRILNVIGVIVFLFYFLWGYNYQRIPYVKQTKLDLIEPDTSMLLEELKALIPRINALRESDEFDSASKIEFKDLNSLLSSEMSETLRQKGYPADYQVDISRWSIKGILLRFSTAGIYIPHSLQGNIDGGLHPLQQPFTASHEMTHAFGITHEGIANLLAYQSCSQSTSTYVQYSAELAYMRYLFSDLRQRLPSESSRWRESLSPQIRSDLEEIKKQMDKYPDIMPRIRDKVYDRYLKQHGIADGMKSYSQLVSLVLSEKARLD